MKFEGFRFQVWKDYINLLPTVLLNFGDPILMCRNFSIEIHFLVFHLRWRWIKED